METKKKQKKRTSRYNAADAASHIYWKRDQLGREVPEVLKREFKAAIVMRYDLSVVETCIVRAWKQRVPYVRSLECPSIASAMADMELLLERIKASVPFVVCACCDLFEDRTHCYCRGSGWLSQSEYNHVLDTNPDHARRIFAGSNQ